MDQSAQPSLKKVSEVLQGEGYTDDQVAQMIADLVKQASAKFYTEAMAVFDDEDMKAIEEADSDEQAEIEIALRYQAKTGKDPKIVSQEFIDGFAEGFLDQYNKDKEAGKPLGPQSQPEATPKDPFSTSSSS